MRVLLEELANRIKSEIPDLDRIVKKINQGWTHAERVSEEQDFYVDSVALNLHSLYTGLERLFEMIARRVDLTLPTGETWHRDLIKQMTQDLAGVRPSVISMESAFVLDKFRRFRHLVQNVYAVNLVPDKMAELISDLSVLWDRLRQEMLAFADFLEDLSHVEQN